MMNLGIFFNNPSVVIFYENHFLYKENVIKTLSRAA